MSIFFHFRANSYFNFISPQVLYEKEVILYLFTSSNRDNTQFSVHKQVSLPSELNLDTSRIQSSHRESSSKLTNLN